MASRELVVAVFAEGAQFREFMEQGGPAATKVFSYAVEDMAKKQIASTTAMQTKLRELRTEYMRTAATAKAGSAEFAAASTLLAKTNRQLGESSMTMGRALDNISRRSVALGRTLTTYVSLPMAAVAAYSAKLFIDFQRNMEMIHTQAGAPQSEVGKQSAGVLKLAQTGSPVGPNQLSQGLFFLESRGLRGAAALKTLKISADAAGMGMANMEDVANALGGAVVTGIKGSENYSKAMGVISATVGNGAMHMADYAAALRTGVLPAAKAAHISLQEVGAALAVLTDRGMPAQMAATRLRMTFAMMQDPTKQAADALAHLGISHFQLAEIMRKDPTTGLLKALELIQAAIDRAKNKTQAYADVLQAFGKGRSSAGILTMLNSLVSPLSSFQGKLALITQQSKNFAEEQARYHQTAAYKIAAAWSSIQASLVNFGHAITPAIVSIADGLKKVVTGFQNLPEPVRQAIGVAAILFATLGPILLIGGKIIRSFIELGIIVKNVMGFFETAAVAENAALASTTTSETAVAAAATATGVAVEASAGKQVIAWESVGGAMVPVIAEENAIGDAAVANAAKVDVLQGSLLKLGSAAVLGALGALTVAIALAFAAGKIDTNGGYNANVTDIFGHPVHKGKEGMTVALDKNTSITFGKGKNGKLGPISENTQHGIIHGTKTISISEAAALFGTTPEELRAALKGVKLHYGPNADAGAKMAAGLGHKPGPIGDVSAAWINAASAAAGVPASLLASIITQESGGHWSINGDSGATGYGQIMPSTGRGLKYNYQDPRGNVMDTGIILAQRIRQYGGNIDKAIASYYGGAYGARVVDTMAGNVRQGGGKYPSVNDYVAMVKARLSPSVITADNNPMAGALGPSIDPAAAAAAAKKLAKAKRDGLAAARAIIKPIEETIKAIKTAVSVDIKTDAGFPAIEKDIRKEVSDYDTSIATVRAKMKTTNKFEQGALQTELSKLQDARKLAAADLVKEINAQALALAKSRTSTYLSSFSSYQKKFSEIQKLSQYNIPGVKIVGFNGSLTKMISDETKSVNDEITRTTNMLKTSKGTAKTYLQNLLKKLTSEKDQLDQEMEQSLQDKISALQQTYDTAKSNFSNAYQALASEIQSMFSEQTQNYIDNVIAKQFYQQAGQLTPAEQALKNFQDASNKRSMQRAITDATVNLINDISKGSDLQTILSDSDAIQTAKDAVTQDQLQVDATKSRNDADLAYAQAVRDYTNQRAADEHQLALSLSSLETSIENGTGSLGDLKQIMDKWGVSLDGQWKLLYNIDLPAAQTALNGPGGLVEATGKLQDAFAALVLWVDKTTGANISITTTSGGITSAGSWAGQVDQNGVPLSAGFYGFDANGKWIGPAFAAGAVVNRPTIGMFGEKGPEAVIPLSKLGNLGGGDIHIHFDGTIIGTDLKRAARELEPHIRSAILRTQRSNATSGIV